MPHLSTSNAPTERRARGLSTLAVLGLCSVLPGCPIDDRVLLERAPIGVGGNVGQGGSAAAADAGAPSSAGADGSVGGSSPQSGGRGGFAGDAGSGGEAGGEPVAGPEGVIENCTCSGSTTCPDLDVNNVADCDETLLQNAHFEKDARAWTEDPGLELAWTAADAANSATSGALAVENQTETDLTGSIMAGAHQCVPISGGKIYELAAQVLLPAEPIEGTSGGMQVVFYSDESCAGKVLDSVTSNLVAVTPSWKAVKLTQRAPTTCRSARVRLVSIKSFRQAPTKILFDNVLAREE